MAGVQKPHCKALRSRKAACRSAISPLSDSPSMVSTRRPASATASHQAGTHDLSIDAHRAGTANPMLATDMRSGQLQLLPQKIRKVEARQHMRSTRSAVYTERDWQMGRHNRSPGVEIGTAKKRGHATRQQHFCQVPAHQGGRLLIIVGIKLVAKRRRCLGNIADRDSGL